MINIAVRAARSAGKILMHYYERADSLTIANKGRNDFVTEVDRSAEQAIIDVLRSKYPNHAILAEETGNHAGQEESQWVIDPLDGTTNYLHGLPQFAVSIAFKFKGQLEHGVVYDPFKEELFTASRGSGALLNERRLRVTQRKGLEGALIGTGFPFRDQTHLDAYLAMLKDVIRDTAGVRRPGSAALDLAYVAAGRYDGFWELGLSEWDLAAGALLVKEAGGAVTDISGGERYLDTGNIVAAGLKTQSALLKLIKPHLDKNLSA